VVVAADILMELLENLVAVAVEECLAVLVVQVLLVRVMLAEVLLHQQPKVLAVAVVQEGQRLLELQQLAVLVELVIMIQSLMLWALLHQQAN
jgi:hypothetical protein